jgi:hypothetical protein
MPKKSAQKIGLSQQKQAIRPSEKVFYNLQTKNSCKIIAQNEESRKEVIFNSRTFEK